jgi:hypothetical protein
MFYDELSREQKKLLGYFDRLDSMDQDLILEILYKSLRMKSSEFSSYCEEFLKHLDEVEQMRESSTRDLFED